MAGYIRKRGKRRDGSTKWQARYWDPADPAHRIEKTFMRKDAAERWLTQQGASILTGTHVDPRRSDRPFREVVEAWRDTWVKVGPKTQLGYESILRAHLLPAFGDRRVASLTRPAIQRYLRELTERGARPGTVRNIYAVLRNVLNTGVRLNTIATNPCIGVELPRPAHEEQLYLTPEEVHALAEEITPHFRLLVYTAAYTGLRAGELHGLRRGRVDRARGVLRVEEALKEVSGNLIYGPPKTGRKRAVALPAFLRAMLNEHLAEPSPGGNGPSDPVFTSTTGSLVRHNLFYKRHFKPAVRRALPEHKHGLRFHDLRHTCAALLISAGGHPKEVSETLGHSSISITMDRYGHLVPGRAEALALALDGLHEAATAPATNVVPLPSVEPDHQPERHAEVESA